MRRWRTAPAPCRRCSRRSTAPGWRWRRWRTAGHRSRTCTSMPPVMPTAAKGGPPGAPGARAEHADGIRRRPLAPVRAPGARQRAHAGVPDPVDRAADHLGAAVRPAVRLGGVAPRLRRPLLRAVPGAWHRRHDGAVRRRLFGHGHARRHRPRRARPAARHAGRARRPARGAHPALRGSGLVAVRHHPIVSAAIGARPHGGAAGIVLVLAVAALLGAAFGAFSNAIALITRRQELVIATMNFIVLPSTFLSSMMMSAKLMPAWIRSAALFNPVNWAVTAARAGFEGDWQLLPRNLGLLAAFTLAAAALATASFGRYRRAG